jgi:photosystem II stability/assembly factor-like uncharacterized protein
MRVLLPFLLLVVPAAARAQRWIPQPTGATAEFRALGAAGERVVWAAGRGGTYTRTFDGGRTWRTDTVPGATRLFFTGVHVVDRDTVILLGTDFDGGAARIVRTTNGGRTWTTTWELVKAGVFMDAMAFWDAQRGIAFGDPVDSAFVVLITDDGGRTWHQVPKGRLPAPQPNEAAFAASGQALAVHGLADAWIVTGGGATARVLRTNDRGTSWSAVETPLAANQSTGLFGQAWGAAGAGWAVGGNHQTPREGGDNVLRTTDGGSTWTVVGSSAPAGVRYGVAVVESGASPILVAVGPSGTGWSRDGGASWTRIGAPDDPVEGFNSVRATPAGAVWAAGTQGRVARLDRLPGR